jgi:hypothetical protein
MVALAAALLLTGLHGVVTRGPTTPVCVAGIPCSKPAAGAVLAFERRGRIVARVRTDARGRYAVRLAPGVYAVTTAPVQRIGSGIRPRLVHVVRGRSLRLDFGIDTGIR